MAKSTSAKATVKIVAIGASAGGLDPYERFFDNTGDNSGVAYVIIQHLSPNFQSMMDELLARHSKMKIERVIDGLNIEPNTIYLNPPRTEMIVSKGRFKLTEYSDNKLLNLPIDTFFQSLAEEAGPDAIAVVLSGTGSDGTKGAQAIKEAGGTVLAQDLASAKFDGMPGSIIKLGYADAVGHPEILAENVGRLLRGLPTIADPNFGIIKSPQQRIFRHLRERFGTEFNYYKTATIDRRLERRASLRNLSMEDYSAVIASEPAEAEALYGDLLIEVTSFFRDPDAFEVLRTEVIPVLAKDMTKTRPVRIWVPGCASGEEAYSLAIMFADYARENELELHLKILATDIHHRSLAKATTGIFPRSSLAGLSQDQLERYFDIDDDTFQIKQHLRRMVVFSPHNILKDPPFTRMDLISCRNVLIYFNDIAQQKTVALFHFSLRKSGYLYLGPSETAGKLDAEFSTVNSKWRIYQKKRDVRLLESVSMLPPSGNDREGFDKLNIRESNTIGRTAPVVGPARQAHNDTLKELLKRYAPPGFLLTEDGEIAHVFGDAGQYLKIESGVFSNRIVELLDDELKVIVSTGLERVKSSANLRFERRITTHDEEFGSHSVVVMIDEISGPGAPQKFFLLTLERLTNAVSEPQQMIDIKTLEADEATGILRTRIDHLERDLKSTEESLQTTIEELETSNEELQATNEELMASNEELQSTNEELHSVNEELYTVSSEHQSKIEELMEATDDMDHLLLATDIGIIFLDEKLQIRRFTPSVKQSFNIILQDIGRPIEHITYKFDKIQIEAEAKSVIATGVPFEKEILVDSLTFMLRILPYRSSNMEVSGVVITVIDISELKQAELDRIETTRKYEAIVHDLTDFLVRWSPETGEITYANQKFSDEVGISLEKIIGSHIDSIGAEVDGPSMFSKRADPKQDSNFENEIIRYDQSGREVYASGTIRPIFDGSETAKRMQATGRNVTEVFNYRNALESVLEYQEDPKSDDEFALFDKILSIGQAYLGMSRGVVAKLTDDVFEVIKVQGEAHSELGQTVPRNKTIGDAIPTVDGIQFSEDIRKTDLDHRKLPLAKNVRGLISTDFSTSNGYFGRIAFSSSEPRRKPFSKEEKMFVRVLSRVAENLMERHEYERDLEYRRQHYLSVYDQAPIMRCTLDKAGKIVEANAVWEETLGFASQDCVGKAFTSFVSDRDFLKDWSTFPEITNSDDGKQTSQTILKSHDGDTVDVELTATRLFEPRTNEERFLIALVDVTEKKRSFERIESQNKELAKANEGLSTFAYVASHDLQEPLRKIRQYVDLLEADCSDKLNKDGRYYLEVITGSSARISYLVKDILAYTTASSADIEIGKLHLDDIVREVLEEANGLIVSSSAKVSVGALPAIDGDTSAVKLLFQNLISNALKYQDGEVVPQISIKSRTLKSQHIIDVVDNGIGIDLTKDQSVFDPFVRLHSKFEYAGTGIGLAICRAVCDRMGWGLSYKPNPKGGTVFSIAIDHSK